MQPKCTTRGIVAPEAVWTHGPKIRLQTPRLFFRPIPVRSLPQCDEWLLRFCKGRGHMLSNGLDISLDHPTLNDANAFRHQKLCLLELVNPTSSGKPMCLLRLCCQVLSNRALHEELLPSAFASKAEEELAGGNILHLHACSSSLRYVVFP